MSESKTSAPFVAIVTGGSKGYGAGTAEVLRQGGAAVWITGRNGDALNEVARKLGVRPICADVTRPGDWDGVIDSVMSRHGRIDLLVNNAGGGVKIAPVDEQTDEEIVESLAANLTGSLFGIRRVVPIMKRQKSGMIINISSICAHRAWPGWAVYSAAKAGLMQMGRCLHTEVRLFGIWVTTVTPSRGATDIVSAADIVGHPAGDLSVSRKCMQPGEMGQLILSLWNMPAHLVVPEVQIQPMVQEVVPM